MWVYTNIHRVSFFSPNLSSVLYSYRSLYEQSMIKLWTSPGISTFLMLYYSSLFHQKQGAQLVVLEGKNRNVWENVWSTSCLDLHLMSSGAARAMVHAWLLNIRSVVLEGHELPKLLRYPSSPSCLVCQKTTNQHNYISTTKRKKKGLAINYLRFIWHNYAVVVIYVETRKIDVRVNCQSLMELGYIAIFLSFELFFVKMKLMHDDV